MRDSVRAAQPVGHQGHPRPVALVAGQLELLPTQERRRGGVGDGGNARVEQAEGGALGVELHLALAHGHDVLDRLGQFALVNPPALPVQVGVGELALLEQLDQVRLLEPHLGQPGPQHGSRIVGSQVSAHRAAAHVALAHHALDDLQQDHRVGP